MRCSSTWASTSDATPEARADEARQIGTSAQGRPIMAVRFGDGPRTVLVVGQTHGDEEGGLRVLLRARSLPLPEGITLWVVPTMNPDGLIVDTRFLANGADPNRRAPSQPEQQAVHDFALAIRPSLTVWYHQNYGWVGGSGASIDAGEAVPGADRAGDVEAQWRLRRGVHVVPDRRRARQQLDPGRAARRAHARRRPGPCARAARRRLRRRALTTTAAPQLPRPRLSTSRSAKMPVAQRSDGCTAPASESLREASRDRFQGCRVPWGVRRAGPG